MAKTETYFDIMNKEIIEVCNALQEIYDGLDEFLSALPDAPEEKSCK